MNGILEVPQRLVTGWGASASIGKEAADLGKRALVLCSRRLKQSELIQQVAEQLAGYQLAVSVHAGEPGEPDVKTVEQILHLAETNEIDVVVGIGGGSILDLAKAVAGLMFPGRKPVKDYFYGEKITGKGIPWVAVPTTSGSGAEATPNSVLSLGKELKQSIRGDRTWLASVVILDPQLTVVCSREVTAWSGMDALTQAIESHVSKGANVLTESYSLRSAQFIANNLYQAYEDPSNREARTGMAYGSLFAGIALANARLGIVHGIAHSIGIHYGVPHGLVCGILLPYSIRYNSGSCAGKYAELAGAMGIGESADELLEWVCSMNQKLGIPLSLAPYGLRREDFPVIVKESLPSGSLKANPKETTAQDLMEFLEGLLHQKEG